MGCSRVAVLQQWGMRRPASLADPFIPLAEEPPPLNRPWPCCLAVYLMLTTGYTHPFSHPSEGAQQPKFGNKLRFTGGRLAPT